jgi:DNA-binding NarL/FixJ family response regulator
MYKILLIVDASFFAHGFSHYVGGLDSFEVDTIGTTETAISKIDMALADLVVLDPHMDGGAGSDVLKYLRLHSPDLPVILLTAHIDPERTIEAMQMGVKGIALKGSIPDTIVRGIKTVLAGGFWFDENVTKPALQYSADRPNRVTRSDELLTKREHQIVDLVCLGLRNRQIADQCSLTEGTVKIHLNSIFRKLSLSSRAELIVNREDLRSKKAVPVN